MADASAMTMGKEAIDKAVKGMDRPYLMRSLSVPFDWPVVGDVKGLHPVSLFAKSAKEIQQWNGRSYCEERQANVVTARF